MNKYKTLAIIGFSALFIITVIFKFITVNNHIVNLTTKFEATEKERIAFFYNLTTTIQNETQIAIKVDNSFKENVVNIMNGRKDAEGLMMKWIKEVNPNAQFGEVSKMYQSLSRTIQGKRTEFFFIEKKLMDIEREYKSYTLVFPNSFICSILGTKQLVYIPIQTEETKQVIETGIDTTSKLDM